MPGRGHGMRSAPRQGARQGLVLRRHVVLKSDRHAQTVLASVLTDGVLAFLRPRSGALLCVRAISGGPIRTSSVVEAGVRRLRQARLSAEGERSPAACADADVEAASDRWPLQRRVSPHRSALRP
jgi:hypothetical protein